LSEDKTFLLLVPPLLPCIRAPDKVVQYSYLNTVVPYEMPIEIGKANELLYIKNTLRCRPAYDAVNSALVHLNTSWCDDEPQEFHLCGMKQALRTLYV
jgi:hypothetical protein